MIRTEAEIAGGDDATLTAYHEVIRDGETAIVAEGWTDAAGREVTRYEARLPFAQLVHLVLNTTEAERAAIDARADWRGVAGEPDAFVAGMRVRTADPLQAKPACALPWNQTRQPGALGTLDFEINPEDGGGWEVTHDDGTSAPYAADELSPVHEVAK